MRGLANRTLAGLAVLLLLGAGCAIRPRPVAERLTAEMAIRSLYARSSGIRDFKGSAAVTVSSSEGGAQNFNISLRFRAPDSYRILVKGFAGMPAAMITMRADSLMAYFPQDNSYVTSGSGEKAIKALAPGMNLDLSQLSSWLTGLIPEHEMNEYKRELTRDGDRAVLSLAKDPWEHRFVLEGEALDPVEESFLFGGKLSWWRTARGFRSYEDGVRFPRVIEMYRDDASAVFDFSRIEVNSGLSEDDLSFTVPANAEQLSFPGFD